MENLSEKDIDYIFQEGSKNHEFPFKNSAWENMEAMLDAQDKKRAKRRYALLAVLLISIVSIGAVYIGLNSNSASPEPSYKKDNIEPIAQTDRVIKQEPSDFVDIQTSESHNSTLQNNTSNNNTSIPTNTEIKKAGYRVTQTRKSPTNTVFAQDNFNSSTTQSIKSTDNNLIVTSENSTHPDFQNKQSNFAVDKVDNSIANTGSLDKQPSLTTERDNLLKIEHSISLLPNTDISNVSYEEKPIETELIDFKKPAINRFAFSLLAGKEWSAVGSMNQAKQGYRFGAEISYLFGNKFQIGSGFIFSRKRYETAGKNYTPQPQFRWVDGQAPEVVNGTCNVFEIPLELTYFFKGNDKNSFFVSAGASTYIMNNEWYDFRWDDQAIMADPNVPKSSSNDNLSRKCIHLFGIGNVSLGYKKYVTKNISAQLSTYVQLPLTGIGMGSVDLFSTGVQMKVSFIK